MGGFRQDRITGRWTIVAPERSNRPGLSAEAGIRQIQIADHDPHCPFCPGNEAMLPHILDEIAADTLPGWGVRAVPNKYPVLVPQAPIPPDPLQSGHGLHEVVIETPRHDADIDELPAGGIEAVIEMWHRRYRRAATQPEIACVALFRNRGSVAGASQAHAHSQLIALPQVPPHLEATLVRAGAHFSETGACLVCEELERELARGARIVRASERFVSLVPYAAANPFEQWIVPRKHIADFGMTAREDRDALAAQLQQAITRLKRAAGNVPYNLAIDPGSLAKAHAPFAHWSLRILPDLTVAGGFEKMTGLAVNPSSPEADARTLREV